MFWMKTGCSLIDFDVIFPMQPLEFTKSLDFGTIYLKTTYKKMKIFNLNLENYFYEKKYLMNLK